MAFSREGFCAHYINEEDVDFWLENQFRTYGSGAGGLGGRSAREIIAKFQEVIQLVDEHNASQGRGSVVGLPDSGLRGPHR